MPPPPLKQKILTVTDSVPAPPEQHEIEIYKDPSEGYGMRLGWKLYVQGVNEQGVAALAGVKVGDKIDRVSLVVCRLCFLQAVLSTPIPLPGADQGIGYYRLGDPT